ncbi:MAG: hypothetical protein ABR540_04310, partial [Acidimicrobiales bacterium]
MSRLRTTASRYGPTSPISDHARHHASVARSSSHARSRRHVDEGLPVRDAKGEDDRMALLHDDLDLPPGLRHDAARRLEADGRRAPGADHAAAATVDAGAPARVPVTGIEPQ